MYIRETVLRNDNILGQRCKGNLNVQTSNSYERLGLRLESYAAPRNSRPSLVEAVLAPKTSQLHRRLTK
jgi:hypothetical protein